MSEHIPVLADEVIEYLDIASSDVVVDGTINGGGHASMIASRLGPQGHLLGIDLDPNALVVSRQRLASALCRVTLVQENFKDLPTILARERVLPNKILLDLGWSTNQFENPLRGFSFRLEGPLSMRLDAEFSSSNLQAETVVNEWSQDQIATILASYGEERFAKKIAEKIVLARKTEPITTTTKLVEIVSAAVPGWYRRARIHPATKTFQALRIVVNDEISSLETFLTEFPFFLSRGGRVAIISFHSLEDRLVKRAFRALAATGEWQVVTKKPITAQAQELQNNPRSRSAKLRVITKI